MTNYSLDDIKKKVDELALLINAPSDLLPSYGYSIDFGYSHIEVDNAGQMHYVTVERGHERNRKTYSQLDDLLFSIFSNATSSMAVDFEINNRTDNKDCRRLMFKKQEELLGLINSNWRQKEQEDHENILKINPFDDFASIRADLSQSLRDNGKTSADAWSEACSKYPLP